MNFTDLVIKNQGFSGLVENTLSQKYIQQVKQLSGGKTYKEWTPGGYIPIPVLEHYAALSYFAGSQPSGFTDKGYQGLLSGLNICRVLEIGPGARPVAQSMCDYFPFDITYITPYPGLLAENSRTWDARVLKGEFPINDEKYDLIIACNVFCQGEKGYYYESSKDMAEMSRSLSDNPCSMAISMSRYRPEIIFDISQVQGSLLYINTSVEDWGDRTLTDLVMIK